MKKLIATCFLVAAYIAAAPAAYGTTMHEAYTIGTTNWEATITTSAGTVQVVLYNLGASTTVTDNISGFFFTLSNGATSGTLANSNGTLVMCCDSSDHFTSSQANQSSGWVLMNSAPIQGVPTSGLYLCDIGCTPSAAGPANTIIGTPTGTLAGSLTSGPHNPFLDGSGVVDVSGGVLYTLTVPGVTSATTITSAWFGFGTSGTDFASTTPEPATFGLVGLSLAGLAGIGLRRKSKARGSEKSTSVL